MTPPEMQRKAIFAHLETIMETCDPRVAREAFAECGLYTLSDAEKKLAATGVLVPDGKTFCDPSPMGTVEGNRKP